MNIISIVLWFPIKSIYNNNVNQCQYSVVWSSMFKTLNYLERAKEVVVILWKKCRENYKETSLWSHNPPTPLGLKNTHQCDTHSRTHTRTQTHTYDTQDARCLLVERERVNCHHPTVTPEKNRSFQNQFERISHNFLISVISFGIWKIYNLT